jgi:hypothetical protein
MMLQIVKNNLKFKLNDFPVKKIAKQGLLFFIYNNIINYYIDFYCNII